MGTAPPRADRKRALGQALSGAPRRGPDRSRWTRARQHYRTLGRRPKRGTAGTEEKGGSTVDEVSDGAKASEMTGDSLDDWQGIDSVPRDGRRILGWDPGIDGGYVIVHWDEARARWMVDRRSIALPTHWARLPAAPVAAKVGNDSRSPRRLAKGETDAQARCRP